MIVTTHDANGRLLRTLEAPSVEDLLLNLAEGEQFIPGEWPIDGGYACDGGFVPFPVPRPSPHHEWDGEAWIDPRTPEQADAEEAAALEARRAATSLSRIDFILAAVAAGIITAGDAKAAVRGEVPDALAPLIDGLPAEARLAAEITWAGATRVERLNPLIVTWAGMLGLSDDDLDALFGID